MLQQFLRHNQIQKKRSFYFYTRFCERHLRTSLYNILLFPVKALSLLNNNKYFTKKEASAYPKLETVEFYAADGKLNADDYQNLCAVANAVRYARDLCNEPGNYLTPEVFAEDINEILKFCYYLVLYITFSMIFSGTKKNILHFARTK